MALSDLQHLGIVEIYEIQLNGVEGGFWGGLIAGLILATVLEFCNES